MRSTDYNDTKRRYLNRARIAFSDKDVLQEFVETFTHRDVHDPKGFSLRNTISKFFHLSTRLSFRQNATQIFRDVLEGLVHHNPEYGNYKSHSLFSTDIDHPVMTDMADIVLSKENVRIAPFAHLLLNNSSLSKESATQYFVENALKSKASIILIPHVNWVNGAKLDVLTICKLLKEANQNLITIVDGAQALANVETRIDSKISNLDIDFYIGCGQKWMGSPLPIGFVRVSDKFIECKQFSRFLFTSDYFSEFAGNFEFLDQKALDTYNIHFSVLFDTIVKKIFQDGKGGMNSYYYPEILTNVEPLIKIIKEKASFNILELPIEMRTGIFSITGNERQLSRLYNKLKEKHFLSTFDEFEFNNSKIDFLRISSPFEKLTENDLEVFEEVVKSLK